MSRNLLVALFVAAGLTLSMWSVGAAQGQNPPRSSSPTGFEARVALVDLALIFKKYEKFSNASNDLKAAVAAKEKELIQEQNALKAKIAQRQNLTNTKEIDEQIARDEANLKLNTQRARDDFVKREAQIYHQTYKEIEDVIKQYAAKNGITLVLRASKEEEISTANPQDVIKEVSQQVIYSAGQMDITDTILETLNRSYKTTQKPTTQPGKAGPTEPAKIAKPIDKTGTKKQ